MIDVPIEYRGVPGAPAKVTEQALTGLLACLIKKLTMFLDKIAQFLLNVYNITTDTITIFYTLRKKG